MAPIKHLPRARIMGPIAQVLGKPKYQVLTKQGFGLMLLGPTPLTWTSQDKWRQSVWAGLGGPILQSWNSSKNYTDFRITAPFFQNEIARFFQR